MPEGSNFDVTTPVGYSSEEPTIATLKNGGFVIASEEDHGDLGDIAIRFFDANGIQVGDTKYVYGMAGDNSAEGRVAVLSNGNIVVAWQNELGINAVILSPEGQFLTSPFVIQNSGGLEDITALDSGGFAILAGFEKEILVNDPDGPRTQTIPYLAATVLDNNGAVLSSFTLPDGSEAGSISELDIGVLAVSWLTTETIPSANPDTPPTYIEHLWSATFNKNGVPYGSAVDYSPVEYARPEVAGLSGGGYAMTWLGEGNAIYARTFSATNAATSPTIVVNVNDTADYSESAIIGLSGGGFVVGWAESSGGSFSFKALRFSSTGVAEGGEIVLASGLADAFEVFLTALPGDGFVASWQVDTNLGRRIQGYIELGSAEGLFTNDGDIVNFNNLTSDQVALIQQMMADGQAASLYRSLGGDDSVNLPDAANATIVPGVTWDFAQTFNGGNGSDYIIGGTGPDIVEGGADNDTLLGWGDHDNLSGGAGRDKLYGGAGDDWLKGGEDGDWLYGESGADTLEGGDSNDFLSGGGGADILRGGGGADELSGADGRDRFEFKGASDSNGDHITDLNSGVHTTLRFDLDPEYLADPNLDTLKFITSDGGYYQFIGSSRFTGAHRPEMSFEWDLADPVNPKTLIRFDENGDGVADGTVTIDGIFMIKPVDPVGNPGEFYALRAPGKLVYLDFENPALAPILYGDNEWTFHPALLKGGQTSQEIGAPSNLSGLPVAQANIVLQTQAIFDGSGIPILITSIRPSASILQTTTTVRFASSETVNDEGEFVYLAIDKEGLFSPVFGAAYSPAIVDRFDQHEQGEVGIFLNLADITYLPRIGEQLRTIQVDINFIAETVAHEVGHSFGLHHIWPGKNNPASPPVIMDYDYYQQNPLFSDTANKLVNFDTGEISSISQNDQYHLLRWALGYSVEEIVEQRHLTPGEWDLATFRASKPFKIVIEPTLIKKIVIAISGSSEAELYGSSFILGEAILPGEDGAFSVELPIWATFEILGFSEANSSVPNVIFGRQTGGTSEIAFTVASLPTASGTIFEFTSSGGAGATVSSFVAQAGLATSLELVGTAGDDILTGGDLDDTLSGLAGNDVLRGGKGADKLIGGEGTDTITYSGDEGGVFVNLTLGRGYTNASFGDTYEGIANVIGSDYNDYIIGDEFVNRLDGGGGDDFLIGAVGPDLIVGGAGSDWASYEDNSGTVFVNMTLNRGYNNSAEGDTYSGIENLIGGLMDDFFIGDEQANRLNGAMGADTYVGAGGADVFMFTYAPGATSVWGNPNVDLILDFATGVDRIELDRTAFPALPVGTLPAAAFFAGTAAHDADHRIIYDSATGKLFYDPDGAGAQAAMLFATLGDSSHPAAIASTDFVVV